MDLVLTKQIFEDHIVNELDVCFCSFFFVRFLFLFLAFCLFVCFWSSLPFFEIGSSKIIRGLVSDVSRRSILKNGRHYAPRLCFPIAQMNRTGFLA